MYSTLLLYKVRVERRTSYLSTFDDLPYPKEGASVPRFCIKLTAEDDPTAIKK